MDLTSKQTAHDLLSELHIFQKRSCFQKRITTFRKGTVFSLVPQGQTRAHSVRLVSAGWLELGDLVYSDLCLFKQRKRETERGGERQRQRQRQRDRETERQRQREREREREGGRERESNFGTNMMPDVFLAHKKFVFWTNFKKILQKRICLE